MALFLPCETKSKQMAPTGGTVQLDGMDLKLTPSVDGHLFDTVWWSGLILATFAGYLMDESQVVHV